MIKVPDKYHKSGYKAIEKFKVYMSYVISGGISGTHPIKEKSEGLDFRGNLITLDSEVIVSTSYGWLSEGIVWKILSVGLPSDYFVIWNPGNHRFYIKSRFYVAAV